MENETKTAEERLNDKIQQLETEHKTKLAEFKENPTRKTSGELDAIVADIRINKTRLENEIALREKYWNIHKDTLTPEDFSRLWESSLRAHAQLKKVEDDSAAKQASSRRYWRGV